MQTPASSRLRRSPESKARQRRLPKPGIRGVLDRAIVPWHRTRPDRIPRMPPGDRWDVFCRVVDNFGDVGVSWRLARQLAREHGKKVCLALDDLTVLAKLRPEIDPAYDAQSLD